MRVVVRPASGASHYPTQCLRTHSLRLPARLVPLPRQCGHQRTQVADSIIQPAADQARPETFHNFSSALHIGASDVKRQYSSLVGSSDATYAPCDHPLQCFAQSTIGAIMSRYAPSHLPAAPQLRAVLTRGLGISYA
jgi:hypothetical protein